MQIADDTQNWRDRAAACREAVAGLQFPETQTRMRQCASWWELLADRMEVLLAQAASRAA